MTTPRIVVTLPARSVREAAGEVEIARAAGADLAEVRFDRWAPEERERAADLFPARLPLLATLRSRAEGGEGPDDPAERSRELRHLGTLPFEGIDLERARDLDLLKPDSPVHLPLRVVSVHLPEGAAPSEIDPGLRPVGRAVVGKVVLPADLTTTLHELIPRLPPASEGPRVLLTTGGAGAILRAWSRRLEFPLVYASLPTGHGTSVEPSQIPADALRAFFDGPPGAPIFAVVGHPVAHSQSPYLHGRWMRAGALSGLYIPLDVVSEREFVDALPALAAGGFRGINVTHPWKATAVDSADEVSRAAERCGAANCLTFRADVISADNTDLASILRRLSELKRDGRWDGERLSVLGAGGSAAATLAAAASLGARAHLMARDAAAVRRLAARFGAEPMDAEHLRSCSLVVHATPVGRAGSGELALPTEGLLAPGGLLLDWVYAADTPTLSRLAERAGAGYEDGWRLLVYQAAASFGLWWGAEPGEAEIASAIAGGPCAV